ncbi:TPA: hypothetical protein L2B26_005405 [Klebsiella oxytoca]|uniref:hypothetical protein n=1 Tax=Klebsiella oxytoca TaxID=571 RepID=UPI0038907F52|nr:hypothetical protein [Klebsiella oxytoca]HBN2794441.1 hypothetical protein [Klebsiella oxytoca]HCC6328526.1 hypothetical protein [Klebsiella oxytoca]
MTAYYLDGSNITWLSYVCLFLFLAGFVAALAVFVIPEKINLRVHRGNTFIFSVLITVVAFITIFVFTSRSFTMDELEAGKHWKSDCKLLEVNIPTGTFTDTVNKLDCAGVIINVPKIQYDGYIRQWELYKDKNK